MDLAAHHAPPSPPFSRNPKETAFTILQELSDVDRIHLVLALQAAVSRDATLRRDTGWADELARKVGAGPTTHTLTRSQVASALEYQRVLTRFSSYSDAVPTWRQLLAVGVASGVPFVGFGMIDNGIMVRHWCGGAICRAWDAL